MHAQSCVHVVIFMHFFMCLSTLHVEEHRKKQIAFFNSPDIAAHKIIERPTERLNNFLSSAKTVGAKVGVRDKEYYYA